MSRKTDDLFGLDTKARWNIMFVSMVVTFITALVFLIGGVSLQIVQIVAAIVGATAYFSQVAVYKFSPRIKWKKSDRVPLGNLVAPFSTLCAAVVIALVMLIASPNIQASVLNRRLRAILETPPSTKRSVETSRILKYAAQSQVKLQPALISKVAIETEKYNDPESWATYLLAATAKQDANKLQFSDISKASADFSLIDGGNLTDSYFSGAKFAYTGGELRLNNVHFDHARLAVADNKNGRKFVEAFIESPDGTISIALGPRYPDKD
jgi:amino acid transporter